MQYLHGTILHGHSFVSTSMGLLTGASLITGDTNNAVSRYGYDIMGRVNTSFDCVPGWCGNLAQRTMNRNYIYDKAGNKTTENWTVGYNTGGGQPSVNLTYTYTQAGEVDTISGGLNDSSQPLFPYFYKAGLHTPFGTQTEQFGNGLQRNGIFDSMGRDSGKWVCINSTEAQDMSLNYDDVGRLSP